MANVPTGCWRCRCRGEFYFFTLPLLLCLCECSNSLLIGIPSYSSSGFPRLQLILMCAKSLWLPKKQCPVRCAEGKSQGQLLRSESPQRMFGPRLNGRIHASIAILRLRTSGQSGSKSCSLKVSALDLPKTQRGR